MTESSSLQRITNAAVHHVLRNRQVIDHLIAKSSVGFHRSAIYLEGIADLFDDHSHSGQTNPTDAITKPATVDPGKMELTVVVEALKFVTEGMIRDELYGIGNETTMSAPQRLAIEKHVATLMVWIEQAKKTYGVE